MYASNVGAFGSQIMPAEFVSSSVFKEDEIIQKSGKLIRIVAAVNNMYNRMRLMGSKISRIAAPNTVRKLPIDPAP